MKTFKTMTARELLMLEYLIVEVIKTYDFSTGEPLTTEAVKTSLRDRLGAAGAIVAGIPDEHIERVFTNVGMRAVEEGEAICKVCGKICNGCEGKEKRNALN